MLGAKSAAPCAESCIWLPPVLTQTTNKAIILFTSPPGYLVTSNLIDKLLKQGRDVFWLRIEPEDCDPGFLLLSLVQCFQRVEPEIVHSTLLDMQRSPGPIMGWLPLFKRLSQEFVEVLPPQSVIVLEHLHYLCEYPATLALLSNSLLYLLPKHFPCILITHQTLPTGAFSDNCVNYQTKDLMINHLVGTTLARHANIDLSDDCIRHVVEISNGRMCALNGILYACEVLGSAYMGRMIKSAKNLNQLLKKLTQELLVASDPTAIKTLVLTCQTSYCHPKITQAVLHKSISLSNPWKQTLDGSWERLLCLWSDPIRSTAKVDLRTKHTILRKVANYLVKQGDISTSLRLFFELKDYEQAAQVLEKNGGLMMDLGQWATLEKWIDGLPNPNLHSYPFLVYLKGELKAASGQFSEGRKTFAMAAQIFSKNNQSKEACQSLLAEGTLAAWQGDVDKAEICFLNADTLARSRRLKQQQGWINWTRGYFASGEANPSEALTYLGQTINIIKDPNINELYGQIEVLLKQQQAIHQQKESLRRDFFNLSQSECEIEQKLSLLLKTPYRFSTFLGDHGWTGLPLILKMSMSRSEVDQGATINFTGSSMMMNLVKILGDLGQRIKRAFTNGKPTDDVIEDKFPLPITSSNLLMQNNLLDVGFKNDTLNSAFYFVEKPYSGETFFIDRTEKVNLSANLFGSCCILINDHPLGDQITGRGLAILQYLLFHHTQKQHREVLMSVFWPDAPPDSARNNLNVALHNLRQSFRSITNLPVIEFHSEAYRFNPTLQIWLDVDEFEYHIQAGQRYEQSNEIELAIKEYETGIDLYQDDFLIDDPYEEWALAPRERLRIVYLNALGNLSQNYFSREQYAACVALCQRILERDNCREDTHCLLMRCYSRLGQRSLALRQYQVCVDALRSELGVNPEIETEQLAEHIRSLGDI